MRDEQMVEKKIDSETMFKGRVLEVRKDRVALPNGNESTREYAVHKGAVCVLPLTAEGDVILVRQYRYAMERVFLEVPAGKLDYVGEIPHEAALRELREETGARCKSLTPLGVLVTSPAILTEKIWMYLAEELDFGETDPDEDEMLDIVKMPLWELVDQVMEGKIEDAKTQTIALKVWNLKRGTPRT